MAEERDTITEVADTGAGYRRLAQGCGAAAMLIGLAGLLGWIAGLPVLNSIVPGSKPIAVSASVVFFLLGLVQVLAVHPALSHGAARMLLVLALLLALFGLLEVITLATPLAVSLEEALLRYFPAWHEDPNAHIAPAAMVLVLLIGLGQAMYLSGRLRGRPEHITHAVGMMGALIMLGSAVFLLGYLYGTPLFSGSIYLPISLLAALAALLLGLGLIATAGRIALPICWFAGSSTRARLLRAFLPLTAAVVLLLSVTQFIFTRLTTVNPALTAAVLITLFEVITGAIILHVARAMGGLLDRAKAEREHLLVEVQQRAAELSQLTATLEERVQARTAEVTQALAREQAARLEAESNRGYFEGLLESAPDGIVIVDERGVITLVNGQAEALSGYRRAEMIGQPIEMLIPARLAEIHHRHRDAFMVEPRTRPMGLGLDLYLRRRDGVEVPVEISLSPFRTATGLLVTASVRDITARKQAEVEIKRLNEELQQNVERLKVAYQELEAFSYSVSHDLRTPLRSIDGFSKILLQDYPACLDARGQDYLGRVRNAAQRMGRLIDDMLNLSRVGRVEMRRETVNLSAVAAATVADLRLRDPERQAEVSIQPDMHVQGDTALLRIVMDNLLGNAWKFTAQREMARIAVGAMTRDDTSVYFVRDNGAGFDMTYVDKLFTPFQRLHTEDEFPGTGIGLAIVQRIITRHGGRVWAEGAEGNGATIYFTLEGEPA